MTRYFLPLVCLGALTAVSPVTGQVSSAYLIKLADGKPVVEIVPQDLFPPSAESRGLLIWSESTGDRWLTLTEGWREKLPAAGRTTPGGFGEGGFSRGGRGGGSDAALVALTRTNLVAPGNLTGQVRGGELLTPLRNSFTFSASPVVRRLPEDKGEKYPAVEGELKAETGEAAGTVRKLKFPAGADRLMITDLKPGQYELNIPNPTNERPKFTVESAARRSAVLGRADELAKELGGGDPLVTLYTVETLLAAKNPVGRSVEGNAPAYLGDALDILESAAEVKLTPYLVQTRNRLRKQSQSLALDRLVTPEKPPADADATGIPAIDEARAALAAGRYKDTEAALAKVPKGDPRAAILATLYRALVLSESGAGADTEAEGLLNQCLIDGDAAERSDRLRLHSNAATFYHRRAQDRLNNHAFQMAAGLARTVTGVVRDWLTAREQYDLASKAAEPRHMAGLQVDLARLHTLLADLVRTLDASKPALALVAAAEEAAESSAEVAAKSAADPVGRGIAREIQAQLAFRRGESKRCREVAALSRSEYLAAGFLPGLENISRLLGQADGQDGKSADAVRNLMASHSIAELLRERYADDRIGRTRAGFFARRAFVLDALVELQLKAGKPDLALEFAEQAKARTFTDLLEADGLSAAQPGGRRLRDILKSWPKNTAAVEYFLSRDRVWAFVVTTAGAVQAFELKGHDGKPLDPLDLIARVRQVVGGMEGYARKMANRILNDEGYDNSWQDDLHTLAGDLLPPDVLAEARKAEIVLLAPQHVLHYLPFAALVIEKDAAATPKRLARPKRFVIDEPFVTVNVPSLTGWDALRAGRGPVGRRAANAVGIVQAPGEARLDGVEKDLAKLKAAFGSDLREVLGEERATVSKAMGLFERRGLLLLSTHGYNDADAPLDSYLVLSADEATTDGRLRARDIYRRTVRSDVVIMSACYTGLGDRSPLPSDDLFGLQRAFLQAGGRAVVAGLWDVYDATAPELLGGCLERLAAGVPAARAVKESQKSFLEKHRAVTGAHTVFAHPYFWAVYSVLGDDQATAGKP